MCVYVFIFEDRRWNYYCKRAMNTYRWGFEGKGGLFAMKTRVVIVERVQVWMKTNHDKNYYVSRERICKFRWILNIVLLVRERDFSDGFVRNCWVFLSMYSETSFYVPRYSGFSVQFLHFFLIYLIAAFTFFFPPQFTSEVFQIEFN